MKSRISYLPSKCVECGAPRSGESQCSNCGSTSKPGGGKDGWSAEKMSPAAKVFTGVFIGWALIFPFLLPIILKVSHIYQ